MKSLRQSLSIILSFVLIFGIINTQLSDYLTYIAGLIIVFIIIFLISKKTMNIADTISYPSIFVFIIQSSILLLIVLTGGISSGLFFLTYFLLFGITFLFEPFTIVIFILGIIIIFFNDILANDVFSNLIKIGSLIVLSPLAFFFGRQYKKRQEIDEKHSK